MGAVSSKIALAFFGSSLMLSLTAVAATLKLLSFLPWWSNNKLMREGWAVLMTRFAWQFALVLAPWMRITPASDFSVHSVQLQADASSVRAAIESGNGIGDKSSAKPVFVLGNHTSFLDTIVAVSRLPAGFIYYARVYMSSYLFKFPILSTICHACGHFPVYFKGTEAGDFSVDRERMAVVTQKFEGHIENGGCFTFFPEGQMNKNPMTLEPFRYGGMKQVLKYDAVLWSFVTCGFEHMWPRKSQMGGFPGKGMYGLRPLAPHGTRKLVAELRAAGKASAETPDHVVLANYLRDEMQSQYDDYMLELGRSPDTKKSD